MMQKIRASILSDLAQQRRAFMASTQLRIAARGFESERSRRIGRLLAQHRSLESELAHVES